MEISIEEQIRIITKGASSIINMEELRVKLEKAKREERPLIIKLGLDPSAPDIHLGHGVVLRKMRQMQDLGHKVVIIIGDFTGRIGDPTGKTKGRSTLTVDEVKENAATYQNQIFKILDKEKTELRYNSEWLSKLTLEDVINLASSTTVARLLERDDFHNRYNNNYPIGLHEFFYPLIQAYDSIAIDADIEVGGTDQTFNLLTGRTLQKYMGKEQQIAIFMPILEGLDGKEKMSKSLGNYIGIDEDALVMFKKVMELPDQLILKYYELATDIHPDEIDLIRQEMAQGKNPRDIKYNLARTITSLYHSEEDTLRAMDFYNTAFVKKAIPDDIPELIIDWEKDLLIDIIPKLVQEKIVPSGSEFRRLLQQGGVQLNGEKIVDLDYVLVTNDVLKIGKKNFIRIIK
ncbi:MAG: tyrosine--tRNA ligase [Clostridiales bacterium]|nr:tyrosine--tRNA ligase [Clostridiales bacterium]